MTKSIQIRPTRRPKPPKLKTLTVSRDEGLTLTFGPEPATVLPFVKPHAPRRKTHDD
jgi:hypothetical protein